MKTIFLSFTAKLGLFALSIGLGVVSYFMFHHLDAAEKLNLELEAAILPPTFQQDINLDAEAFLLAKTDSPVDLTSDAFGIFYILQRDGKVVRVAPEVGGGTTATAYGSFGSPRTDTSLGFTSIALHPNFLVKDKPGYGRFYMIASEKSGTGQPDFRPEFGGGSEHHQGVLYEYTVEDPLLTDFRGQRRELMRFSQPGKDNNLSGLAFDPAGLLYLGVGDGAAGATGDQSPSRNASSLTSAFGKVLRIDPTGTGSANGKYGIPEANPFRLVTAALPEVWAFGLRAPHSLSFDPFHRSLYIAESGIKGKEEINISPLGGEHFGWDLCEDAATMSLSMKAQLAEIVTPPAVSLDLRAGLIARNTGSLVYRGESFPSLAGKILFASHDGQLVATNSSTGSGSTSRFSRVGVGALGQESFTALRSGPRGELVILCENGNVFELRKGTSIGIGGSKHRSLFCSIQGPGTPKG